MSGRLGTLADIIGPTAPHSSVASGHWGLWAVSLAAVGLGALVITLWVRSKETRCLRRRVRRLRRRYRAGHLSERETAYQLARELGRTLRMKRITVSVPPPRLASADTVRWEQFVARLDALRYQPGDGNARHGDIEALLTWVQGLPGGWL